MSMRGELENLNDELRKTKEKVSKLQNKIASLKELMKKDEQDGIS